MNITTFNKMPVIIDGPGMYTTRGGGRVRIDAVTYFKPEPGGPSRLEVTAFEAGGSIERMYRGKMRFRGWNCWHVCGRRFPLTESKHDIVGKEVS